MIEAAIFPIPGCVVFPGTLFPLHVFEPRYRAMVKHCASTKLPLAIAHTQKVLSKPKKDQSIVDALNTNQATYKPFDIFSAGECDIIQTYPDGRMMVNVRINQRLRLIHEKQTLPYIIGECEAVPDQPIAERDLPKAQQYQAQIVERLLGLTHDLPKLKNIIEREQWQTKTPQVFSFDVFRVLQLDADLQQKILESPSALARLGATLEFLNAQ